jgi:hypothetical protein
MDVPEDIREKAEAIVELLRDVIMMERERCAQIADKFAAKPIRSKTPGQYDRTSSAAQTGKRIAAAIRQS